MKRRLSLRNPYNIYTYLELYFYYLTNISFLVIFLTMRYFIDLDIKLFEEYGVTGSKDKIHSFIKHLVALTIVEILILTCLILPRTRCLQRRLNCYVFWVNTSFHLVCQFIRMGLVYYIGKQASDVHKVHTTSNIR